MAAPSPAPSKPHLLLMALAGLGLAACTGGDGGADAAGRTAAGPDPVPEAPGAAPEGAGRLVIIGGALQADNDAVYDAVVEGLQGDGPLCILPTASGSPQSSMASAAERFRSRLPDRAVEGILLTVDRPDEARDPAVVARIRACAGFFFTGGSQSRIIDVFRPGEGDTAAYDALMDRWLAGAVVAGTSAGAAMMSTPSIGGGSSEGALAHGVRSTDDGDGVWVRPGMDLVGWGIVDQHFLARGRWGRLLVAVGDSDATDRGVGIDENTALVMDGPSGRVVGASGVIWVREASEPGIFQMALLGRGDRITPTTGVFEPALGKQALVEPVDPENTGAPTGGGPFDRWALLHALEALGRSPDPSLTLSHATGTVRLEKAPGFVALRDDGTGVEGAAPGLTVGPVRVVLEPAGASRPADGEG